MSTIPDVAYHYAVLRVVPHVYLGAFVNVGVIVHARTVDVLTMRAVTDAKALRALVPEVDLELLTRYLECYDGICRGDARAGAIALLPPSERFHWLTAPRSDVLQVSAVHVGLGDPEQAVAELFRAVVPGPHEPDASPGPRDAAHPAG
jgi:hypothetical protein